MKLAHGYRRSWHLKIFFYFSTGGHHAYWKEMILAILAGSHLGNIPVTFEPHWPQVSGGVSF